MSEELKPCPFCGSHAIGYSEHFRVVRCNTCWVRTGDGTEEEATKQWNCRHSQPTPTVAKIAADVAADLPDYVQVDKHDYAIYTGYRTADAQEMIERAFAGLEPKPVSVPSAGAEEVAVIGGAEPKCDTIENILQSCPYPLLRQPYEWLLSALAPLEPKPVSADVEQIVQKAVDDLLYQCRWGAGNSVSPEMSKSIILAAITAALAPLQAELEQERENHAQLQARCYEGFPSASDGIFDALKELQAELEQIKQALNKAGVAIGNEHETYTLVKRIEWLNTAKDYAWRQLDATRADLTQARDSATEFSRKFDCAEAAVAENCRTIARLEKELEQAKAEVIRMAGLVIERDGWLPQEERTKMEQRLATAEAALVEAKNTIKALHGPEAWEIYDQHSPEMKRLNAAIDKARGEQS